MDILFVSSTLNSSSATSACVCSVVNEAVKRGHHCVIVSYSGIVYDSTIDEKPRDSGMPAAKLTREGLWGKFVSYLRSYRPFFLIKHNEEVRCLKKVVFGQLLRSDPDVVVSTLNPIESLIVGNLVKKRLQNKVKYVPYFLDAIYAGKSPTGMPTLVHDLRALYRESCLLKDADSVVMMHSANNKYKDCKLKPSYFNKIKFLDLPLLSLEERCICERSFFPKNQVVILFAGTMPRSVRDPRFFISVFSRLKVNNIHLYFAGLSEYQSELEVASLSDDRVHLLGMLKPHVVKQLQNEADYLLNFGNHYSGMTPSKIFSYMSARKPIISTYYINNDPCNEYLRKYGFALLLDEKGDIDKAVIALQVFLKESSEVVNYERIEDIFYNNTPSAFIDHIEKVCLNSK